MRKTHLDFTYHYQALQPREGGGTRLHRQRWCHYEVALATPDPAEVEKVYDTEPVLQVRRLAVYRWQGRYYTPQTAQPVFSAGKVIESVPHAKSFEWVDRMTHVWRDALLLENQILVRCREPKLVPLPGAWSLHVGANVGVGLLELARGAARGLPMTGEVERGILNPSAFGYGLDRDHSPSAASLRAWISSQFPELPRPCLVEGEAAVERYIASVRDSFPGLLESFPAVDTAANPAELPPAVENRVQVIALSQVLSQRDTVAPDARYHNFPTGTVSNPPMPRRGVTAASEPESVAEEESFAL